MLEAEVQVIEGAWPGSVVLIGFPSMTEARKWYDSPEYQEIVRLRTDNTISDLVLVDSVGPDFTVAGYAQQIPAAIAAGSTTD